MKTSNRRIQVQFYAILKRIGHIAYRYNPDVVTVKTQVVIYIILIIIYTL